MSTLWALGHYLSYRAAEGSCRNLSAMTFGDRLFGNHKMPLCIVDRGNPVCYR